MGIFRTLGDWRGIAYLLEAFAGLAIKSGKTQQAVKLWATAKVLREEIGSPLELDEQEKYDADVTKVQETLGEKAFSVLWQKGVAMTLEQAIEYALQE
jgi:hypothetical protein